MTKLDTTKTNEILLRAAVEASRALGANLLKMSCFVSNWPKLKRPQA